MPSQLTSKSKYAKIKYLLQLPVILRRVQGHSMEPTLKEGKLVMAYTHRPARRGDIVIAKIDHHIEVVKRIVDIRFGLIYLDGDNKGHTKRYSVMPDDIIAVVKS